MKIKKLRELMKLHPKSETYTGKFKNHRGSGYDEVVKLGKSILKITYE